MCHRLPSEDWDASRPSPVRRDNIVEQELARKAKAIANELIAKNLVGERVLLIYPAGLEFIAAFLES